MARACVEAMAFQVRDMTDAMAAACSYPLSALRADGGAAAMDLLLQLQADQSRMTVARPRRSSRPRWGRPPSPGWPRGCGRRSTSCRLSGRRRPSSRPQLPAEFGDAAHAAWRRAVEKSMGWADLHRGRRAPASLPGPPGSGDGNLCAKQESCAAIGALGLPRNRSREQNEPGGAGVALADPDACAAPMQGVQRGIGRTSSAGSRSSVRSAPSGDVRRRDRRHGAG